MSELYRSCSSNRKKKRRFNQQRSIFGLSVRQCSVTLPLVNGFAKRCNPIFFFFFFSFFFPFYFYLFRFYPSAPATGSYNALWVFCDANACSFLVLLFLVCCCKSTECVYQIYIKFIYQRKKKIFINKSLVCLNPVYLRWDFMFASVEAQTKVNLMCTDVIRLSNKLASITAKNRYSFSTRISAEVN